MGDYTLVTVFHEADRQAMQLHARSIALYCSPDFVRRILIIENFERKAENHREGLLHEFGQLADLVWFLPASEFAIVGGSNVEGRPKGWWTQQLLKLMAAEVIATDRYVAFDAKNVLVFPLTRNFFEGPSGKPHLHLLNYSDHAMRPDLEAVMVAVGLYPEAHIDKFPTAATPFVFHTELVRSLMATLSDRERASFKSLFISRQYTEFPLYSAFLISLGRLADLYEFHSDYRHLTIWEPWATADGLERAIATTIEHKSPFFSLHRRAIYRFDAISVDLLIAFWISRGLFPSEADAHTYISTIKRIERQAVLAKRFWSFPRRLVSTAKRRLLSPSA